jgi:RsiW-degrading membrane proteinase PrsW (M82 family)
MTRAPAILPARPDRAARYLLVVAGLMSTAYAVQLLVDLGRPKADPDEPAVGLLGDVWPALPKVEFWFTIAAWAVALALGAVVVVGRVRGAPTGTGEPWRMRLLLAAVLLVPFTTYPIATAFGHLGTLLVCLPSTLLALWAVMRMQRYRRVPLSLLFAVFGWGALVGAGFGAAMNTWVLEYGSAYFSGGVNLVQVLHKVHFASFVSAGISEELGKGAGVALAYLLFRRYFDGVVSGIVLGAAAGLGFNLVESVEYMAAFNGASAEFQYWVRQSIGIMAAHTAFSATVGAGFGVARQLAEPRLRRAAIACGFIGAAGAHFANDTLLAWYTEVHGGWFKVGQAVDVLVMQPLTLAVLQGPFVVLYLLLLRRGLRGQGAGLSAGLRGEVATGLGAVTDAEVPVLLDPGRRLWLGITTLRRYGWAAYRALGRLQAAQFELGLLRWHRARGEAGEAAPDEDALRVLVARRRAELAVAIASPAVGPPPQRSPSDLPAPEQPPARPTQAPA